MKASFFTGIEQFDVRELPIPTVESGGILIKVMACGICGSDIRNFHNGLRAEIGEQIIGHEISGVVEAVGEGVTRFKNGDRVAIAPDVSCGACWYCKRGLVNLCDNHRMIGTHWAGGFAQYVMLPKVVMERGMVCAIPDSLGFYEATLGEPLSSVVAAQKNAGVGDGDTVVVIGDGPIGCMHMETARANGATTVIMVGLTRLESAKQFAPDFLIDAASDNPVKRVREITNGLGADIVITANPVAKTHTQAVDMVRKRGKVVLFGGLPKDNPVSCIDGNKVHYGEIVIQGAFSYDAATNKKAIEFLAQGKIDAKKYINKVVKLEEIKEGIAAAEKGEALKVVVDPWM